MFFIDRSSAFSCSRQKAEVRFIDSGGLRRKITGYFDHFEPLFFTYKNAV